MNEELKNEVTEAEEETTVAEASESAEVGESAENVGNVRISADVISTIAGIATAELEGVAGMYSSFADGLVEKLGAKKNPSKGVKVDMTEETVSIDLYIVVDYGVRIPELSWEIQENVKNNVETMTGLTVEKVNIHIEGVSFEKDIAETDIPEPELIEEGEE